jgi:hypothetical protein
MHSVRSAIWLQLSFGTQTPPGQVVPAGQATPRPCHAHCSAVSAAQDAESVWAAHGEVAR